jgi:SSS family solute:Na+ symporter
VFSVIVYLFALYVIRPIRLEAGEYFPHFLHLMGIIFVIVVLIMLVISKIKPRETDFTDVYTKQVDITQWKYLKPVGYSICALVVFIYIYFS